LLHGQDLVQLFHNLFQTEKNKLFIERDIEGCSLDAFELDVITGVSVVGVSVDIIVVVESVEVAVVLASADGVAVVKSVNLIRNILKCP